MLQANQSMPFWCYLQETINYNRLQNYIEQFTVITLLPVNIATARKGTTTNPIISRPAFPTQKHSTFMGMLSDFILNFFFYFKKIKLAAFAY